MFYGLCFQNRFITKNCTHKHAKVQSCTCTTRNFIPRRQNNQTVKILSSSAARKTWNNMKYFTQVKDNQLLQSISIDYFYQHNNVQKELYDAVTMISTKTFYFISLQHITAQRLYTVKNCVKISFRQTQCKLAKFNELKIDGLIRM